jgi:hypothetical protein
MLDVFSLGLSIEMITIFDTADLEITRAGYFEGYHSRGGFVVPQANLGIFRNYHNVPYGKVPSECEP